MFIVARRESVPHQQHVCFAYRTRKDDSTCDEGGARLLSVDAAALNGCPLRGRQALLVSFSDGA